MNSVAWPPRIGAWYLRWDKGEVFQVTGYDSHTQRARIRTYDGRVECIDELTWDCLSLGLADPEENWAGPLESIDVVRFGSAQNDPISEDTAGPVTAVP